MGTSSTREETQDIQKMIPVPRPSRQNEPAEFDARCRKPGLNWLESHPDWKCDDLPSSRWSAFSECLAALSAHRCFWLGMFVPTGHVDHFIPVAEVKGTSRVNLIFEWTNLRWAYADVNQRKSAKRSGEVLDPCRIKDGWFEISLPDLQLKLTDKVPRGKKKVAQQTIDGLGLNLPYVIRMRQNYYRHYIDGKIDLDHVRENAPLLADALEKIDSKSSPAGRRRRRSP